MKRSGVQIGVNQATPPLLYKATMNRTVKLATFLTILASSEAFAPSARVPRQNVALSATSNDESDGWKKMSHGAAGFLTGLGFMAQVALADPSSIASVEQRKRDAYC